MRATNRHNEYADALGNLFDHTPKAVFAALAVSALTQGGDLLDEAVPRLLSVWRTLHDQGIIPQQPPRSTQ